MDSHQPLEIAINTSVLHGASARAKVVDCSERRINDHRGNSCAAEKRKGRPSHSTFANLWERTPSRTIAAQIVLQNVVMAREVAVSMRLVQNWVEIFDELRRVAVLMGCGGVDRKVPHHQLNTRPIAQSGCIHYLTEMHRNTGLLCQLLEKYGTFVHTFQSAFELISVAYTW
eukprot:SAG31_NODE_3983_length_3688_cov_5.820006_5_plen_172_part_00